MPRSPVPRAVAFLVALGLGALLWFPLHVAYQNPDQDVPVTTALSEFVRGDWQPLNVIYPSAFTNALRVGYEAAFVVGHARGTWNARTDLVRSWCVDPRRFRTAARVLAILSGGIALWAIHRLSRDAAGPWAGVAGALLLGTAPAFVREFHYGMQDAPAAAFAALALAGAGRYAQRGHGLFVASIAAGVAVSCKYNLTPIVVALLAAVVVAPGTRRVRAAGVALGATVLAFALTSPGLLRDALRVQRELAGFAPLQFAALAWAAGDGGNRLAHVLYCGLGVVPLAAAAVGVVRAGRARALALLPSGAFVAAYGLLLWRTPLVLPRYALPLVMPLMTFAAYGLAALRAPSAFAVGLTLALLCTVPPSLTFLRLLGTEDTRVAAAEWLRPAIARGATVFLPVGVEFTHYGGPDLPTADQLWGVDAAQVATLAAGTMCAAPIRIFGRDLHGADANALAPYRGGFIVTSDAPDPLLARAATPPAAVAVVEQHAQLVWDLPTEGTAAARRYEPFDLNYIPLAGGRSLLRPGPRLRIWWVPPAP